MEDRDYILFEDYISHSLTESEREAFENRLREEDSFREAFEVYKETSSFLAHKFSDKTEREAFKANLSKISSAQPGRTKSPVKKIKLLHPWKLAVAASVLVIIGFFYAQWFTTPVYNDFADYPQISLTVRGTPSEVLSEAQKAFNDKNYNEAIPLFRDFLKTEPNHNEIKMYLAIALVEENHFNEADTIFENLLQVPSAYLNEVRWYAALSKLKQKEYKATKSLLRLIPKDADVHQKAQKLLKKL